MPEITGFHAHVYYAKDSMARARRLCEAARDRFGLQMGRMHQKPVGPHPMWSCQLAIPADKFGDVVPWLALNRDGLVIFTHPETGDHLADHTDHALWMGAMPALNLSMFDRAAE